MAETTLVFDISGSLFGIDAKYVTSVCALGAVAPVPACPGCVSGICFLRGEAYPVIDLAVLADIEREGEYKCAVLVRYGDMDVGIMADNVVRTVRDEPLPSPSGAKGSLFGSFLPDKTAVIDMDRLFGAILRSTEGVI